jgi:hypothetical protein
MIFRFARRTLWKVLIGAGCLGLLSSLFVMGTHADRDMGLYPAIQQHYELFLPNWALPWKR